MSLRKGLLAAVALTAMALWAADAHAQVETSIRSSVWSGERTVIEDDDPILNLELWGRGHWDLGETLAVHAEGWAATDPIGDGEADIELREGYLRWQLDKVRVVAGRQVFAWGRADRLNPTDVLAARDMRRLVEDDADHRLGIGALAIQTDVAGGELSAIWAPEFRATRLPQSFEGRGFPVFHEDPDNEASQFALRYERFGQSFDWSVSYADVLDRSPWLSIIEAGPTNRSIVLFHPRLRMLGGDVATTIGSLGVRAEAAAYHSDDADLRGAAFRKPTFALALGADHDFPWRINLNVQALVRTSEALSVPVSQVQAPAARSNEPIQYTWRDTIVGGLVRVRKSFDADRGSVEASVGAFGGGGNYQQIKFGYALADGIRLTAMAERYAGEANTLLGRLENNSLVTLGFRFGF